MKKARAIIFDMDGTLYSFDQRRESHFSSSRFGQTIHENCIRFFQKQFSLDREKAERMYQDFKVRHNGEVSLGLEKEMGIDRQIYFAQTWDLNPEEFVRASQDLAQQLSRLTILTGVLTAAPRIWADKVLTFLAIKQQFEPAIFTGDPDIRKPDPQAFKQLADFWQLDPSEIISIGDQEQTDILPAKSLGMITARIGREVESVADIVAPDVIQTIALLKLKKII